MPDQFFTKPCIAAKLLSSLPPFDFYIEPSAGAGAFSRLLPADRHIALDLEPLTEGIQQGDYLQWVAPPLTGNVLTVGNPPFGHAANLVIKFINQASAYSQCVAFIVPRSMRKASLQRRIDPRMRLIYDETLPLDSFILPSGEAYNVPCCWQVWEKQEGERTLDKTPFRLPYTTRDKSNISVRRVGSRAGHAHWTTGHECLTTHYFLRVTPESRDAMINLVNSLDWSICDQTVGPRSLSKEEFEAVWFAGRVV